jgi:hypothetical protein
MIFPRTSPYASFYSFVELVLANITKIRRKKRSRCVNFIEAQARWVKQVGFPGILIFILLFFHLIFSFSIYFSC